MIGSYRATIDHHLRGRRAGIAEFPCKKGQRPNLPSARGRSHRRGEGTRAPAAGLHPSFLSDRSSTSPPQPPFFRSFPPFFRSQAELDRPVCVAMFFFARSSRTPRNSWKTRFGMAAKTIWEGNISTSRSGRQPAPRTPLPSRHFDRSPGPRPGRSGEIRRALPPENNGDATGQCLGPAAVAGRVSPLRLRSGQAASLRSK